MLFPDGFPHSMHTGFFVVVMVAAILVPFNLFRQMYTLKANRNSNVFRIIRTWFNSWNGTSRCCGGRQRTNREAQAPRW